MTDDERMRANDAEEGTRDRDVAEDQDFALRNTMMSNALPNSAQPAAGAIVGTERAETDLSMQPETDEEIVGGDEEDRAAAVESDTDRATDAGRAG